MAENHVDPKLVQTESKVSAEEEFKKLMQEPDPLMEVDIYATEKKEGAQALPAVNSEETEMEMDLGDVLAKSFKQERNRNSLVQNIPQILKKKDDDSYQKLFSGLTERDVKNFEM